MSNLRKFLFYFSLMAVVVGASAIGYFVQKNYYAEMQDRLLNDFFAPVQKTQAQFIASQLESRVNNIINILKTTATLPALQSIAKNCTAEQVVITEQALVALKDGVDYVGLINDKGTVVCMADLPEMNGKSIADFPHIKEAIATHRMVVSRAIVNPVGIKLIFIGVPIFANGGKFVGILSGPIRLDSLNKQLSDMITVAPSSYNILLDDDGTIFAHQRTELEMQNVFSEANQAAIGANIDLNNIYRRMLKGEVGYDFYTVDGDKKIIGYAPIKITTGNRFFSVGVVANMADYGYVKDKYFASDLPANLGIPLVAIFAIFAIFYLRETNIRHSGGRAQK